MFKFLFKSSWTGTIISKQIQDRVDSDGDKYQLNNIQVKLDGSGKVKGHNVSAKDYNSYNVGDKLFKDTGQHGFHKA